jgi:6-phosphogluconolactonase
VTIERKVLVNADRDELARFVAARFITKTRSIVARKGRASVVLTGGSVGIAVLKAVNDSAKRDTVDWSALDWWWGDERWLARADPERNELQARNALLDQLAISETSVHPFAASDDGIDVDTAAKQYAAELAAHAAPGQQLPSFDIAFLGVGPDGHIASLFPEFPGIREPDATVIAVRNAPKPPPERLSLTLPVINSAERVWLVLAGADKASALGLALAGANANEVPAAGAHGKKRTIFFVDRAATAEVPENLTATEVYWTAADANSNDD